jgi:serine/threonine protein kinase
LGRAKCYTPIQWKIFEPFSEAKGDLEIIGFSLGAAGNTQDFYCDSTDEMDMWVFCFRKCSVLRGINDDYMMGDSLGEGNYATVVLGTNNETEEPVAIKCILKSKIMRSAQGAKIIVNEIKCMRSLQHHNIVKLERVYEDEDRVYLVLEYVEGGDLFTRIINDEESFTEKISSVLICKLLVALAYMHKQGFVHRDLKLENILVKPDEHQLDVKIADFGFATELNSADLSICCGSPGYVAPEILRRQKYGSNADVFGVGVILYILLSKTSPFFGRCVEETLAKNRDCQINFNDGVWASISDDAKSFISQLTERNPRTRPSAAEALEHRWIQTHNKNYFEMLRNLIPTFSKRRITNQVFVSNLPGDPKPQREAFLPSIKPKSKATSPVGTTRHPKRFDNLRVPIRRELRGSHSPRSAIERTPASPIPTVVSPSSAGGKVSLKWGQARRADREQ